MELRPNRFASVPNEAADTLPDLNSVGMLTMMLRHAPGYRFTVGDVIKQKSKIPGPKLGKTAAYGAMDTLIEHRWACRVRFMCSKGHWITGLFRTYTRFTDDDFREVCRRFKAGTSIRVRCKGCSKNPEDEIQTIIRPGAKLTWSGSITAGPDYKYGHPITELMEPGGLLSTVPVPEVDEQPTPHPSSAFPEVGRTSPNDASPQVDPTSGFPTVGQPTVGNPEVFYKTGVEDSSSSSSDSTTSPAPNGSGEEEEKSPTAKKTPDAAETVMAHTDATTTEAEAVLDAIEAEAEGKKIRVGSIDAYVAGFSVRDLSRHLRSVRAQRASQARTKANETAEADTRCQAHHEPMPCIVCHTSSKPVLVGLLKKYGPARRPDIAQRLDELVGAN